MDWYIQKRGIKLCKLYYPPFNFKRTGCKGCPYNIQIAEELRILERYLPHERRQCEIIWGKIYEEYQRIGYRRMSNYKSKYPEWRECFSIYLDEIEKLADLLNKLDIKIKRSTYLKQPKLIVEKDGVKLVCLCNPNSKNNKEELIEIQRGNGESIGSFTARQALSRIKKEQRITTK